MADIIVRPLSDSSTTITVSKGFIGPPGRAATATVGTTTTGAAGSNASVTNVGTVFDAVFDFVIPKGDKGDAATIAVGTVTTLTPDQNPTVTNSGTSAAAVFDFGLPSAATLDLGTVTIVNPDQNPSVTDVGTSGNVVLDINIPRAADVTVQSAIVLNPDQDPSVADNGTNGDVDLTFSIPRAASVNVNAVTVVNPDINPSVADTGTDGDVDLTFSIPRAATLDLGSITVVTPDTSPSITDVGLNGDAEFNFSLPRAATITLATTNVVNPDVNPSVADTGTDGDAVYTFSLPRAAVLSLGTVSVLNPDQNPTITSATVDGDVTFNFGVPRAADVSIGSVTQLSAGTPPTVTDSGTNGDVVLDFGLPQGDAATINVGTVSTLNPDQNPSVTNVGTTSAAVLDFGLPRAPLFTVGTVTTGTPGSSATVTDVGTDGDIVLDFSIPEGDKGDKGDKGDAATLNVGTVSVVNPDQNPSVTNVGTVNAAIFDFDLPRAPTFTVGTVTTGAAGSSVTITDVGTNGDITLDFSIPKGDTGAGVATGGTTDQILTKASGTDFDTQWVSTIDASVIYDNTGSTLSATLVQTAIDELDVKKLDVSALTSSVTFFPTDAASDIGGYGKLVTSTADPDYDTVAVNVNTGTFSGTDNLVGSLASVAGVLEGNTTPINVTTVGQVRRVTGNTNDGASFYFEVYKRDSLGAETLIGTSDNTTTVSSTSYEEFSASALISDTTFTDTDRVVIKFYADVVAGGGGVTYDFQYGGNTPVRTLFPVPVSVIPSLTDAEDIIVDASGFSGLLSGTDDDVQQALSTLDSVTKTEIGLGNVTNDAQLKIASDLSDLNDAATARTNLGLGNVDNVSAADLRDRSTHTGTQTLSTISDAGTIASQDANNVSITGGNVDATLAYDNTVSGLTATDVKGALDELEAEKVFKTGDTGSAEIPTGTEAERDGAPSAGYFRFNTDTNLFEGYNGTAWSNVGAGATGGGGDQVFIENDQTVTANYTIPTGKNALTTGPLEIDAGVTVTISTGSRWIVL